jgi:hypothetical protein
VDREPQTRTGGIERIPPWFLALLLSFLLLAIPAWQLTATLSVIGNRTDVSRAVWDGLASPPVRLVVVGFVVSQVVLHAGFAALVVLLARWTARAFPRSASVQGYVVLWFALGTLAVLGLNALWFPRSESGAYYHELAATPLLGVPAAELLAAAIAALAAGTLFVAVAKTVSPSRLRRTPVALVAGVATVAVVAYGAVSAGARAAQDADASGTRPHVILLGVDSLRLAELGRNGGSGKTPHLDAFLKDADLFTDVTTPVARTFPSWVAILTGRHPRETGAVFNLIPRELIRAQPTLADTLREHGYRTVLATDEVRFSNIDESYGFDQLITPPIGAADFLMGKITDLPLTNVVANTWLGGELFPHTHGNRAAAQLFKPRSFVQRLEAELDFEQPTLLVTHLCAAHWPYFVAEVPKDADRREHDDDRPLYDIGLGTADRMFGDIVSILERKGALRNAIVVVLSDHGEALAVSGDALLGETQTDRVAGLQVPVNLMDWGHGQSVLSPVQYQVLLAFRGYGAAAGYRATGRTLDAPATVLDIKPTVLDVLGLSEVEPSTYAQSLGPLLEGGDASLAARLRDRTRFTETDLRVAADALGDVDEDEAAKHNSFYFAVDRESGRLQLRPESFSSLMALKERAAILGPMLLAALPADVEHHQYLLVDRHTGVGRVLAAEPSPADRTAHELWNQLQATFGDELHPPTVLAPEQMPQVMERWARFLQAARRPDAAAGRGT